MIDSIVPDSCEIREQEEDPQQEDQVPRRS